MKIHNIITILAFALMFQSSSIIAAEKAKGKGKKGNAVFELFDETGSSIAEGPLSSLPSVADLDDAVLMEAIKEGNADIVYKVLKANVQPTQKHVALAERLGHKGIELLLKGTISVINGMISQQFVPAAGGAGDSQLPHSVEAQQMGLAAAINAGYPSEVIQTFFRQGVRATPEHIKLAEQKGRRDIADLLKMDLAKHSPAQSRKASSQSSVTSPAMSKSALKEKEKKEKKATLSDFTQDVSPETASSYLETVIDTGDATQVAILVAQGVKPTQAQIDKAEQMNRSDIVDILTGKIKAELLIDVTWKGKKIARFSKDQGLSQADWNRQVKKATQDQIEREFLSELTQSIEDGNADNVRLTLFVAPFLKNIPKSLDAFIQQAQLKGHSGIVEMLKESNEKLKAKHAEETERERQIEKKKKREQQEKERAKQEAALKALRQKKEKEERGKAQFQAEQRRHQEKEAAKIAKAQAAKAEAERQKAEQDRIKMQGEADRKKAKDKRATKKAAEQEAERLRLLEKQQEKQKEDHKRLENELLVKVRTLVAQSRQIMQKIADLKTKKYETIEDYASLLLELETHKRELDTIATQAQSDKKTVTTEDKLRKYTSSTDQIVQVQTQVEAELTQALAAHTRLKQAKEQAEQARLAREQEEQNKRLQEQEQAKQAAELERLRSQQQDREKEKTQDLLPAPVEEPERTLTVPAQPFEHGERERQKIEEAELFVKLESLAKLSIALKNKNAQVKPLETLEEYDALLSKLKDDLPLFENLFEQAEDLRKNKKELWKAKFTTKFDEIQQNLNGHKMLITKIEERRVEVQKTLEEAAVQEAESVIAQEPESTASAVSAPELAQTLPALVAYQHLAYPMPYPTVAQQAPMAPQPVVGHFPAPVQTTYHNPHYAQGYPYQMGAGYSVPVPMHYAPQMNTYAYQQQHVQPRYAMPSTPATPAWGYQMAAAPVQTYPASHVPAMGMGTGHSYAPAPTISLPAHAIDESTMLQQMKESEAGFLTEIRNAIAKE